MIVIVPSIPSISSRNRTGPHLPSEEPPQQMPAAEQADQIDHQGDKGLLPAEAQLDGEGPLRPDDQAPGGGYTPYRGDEPQAGDDRDADQGSQKDQDPEVGVQPMRERKQQDTGQGREPHEERIHRRGMLRGFPQLTNPGG